jgi:hypothetical protein
LRSHSFVDIQYAMKSQTTKASKIASVLHLAMRFSFICLTKYWRVSSLGVREYREKRREEPDYSCDGDLHFGLS